MQHTVEINNNKDEAMSEKKSLIAKINDKLFSYNNEDVYIEINVIGMMVDDIGSHKYELNQKITKFLNRNLNITNVRYDVLNRCLLYTNINGEEKEKKIVITKHYLTNSELYTELYNSRKNNKISNRLGQMFMDMATKISMMFHYDDEFDKHNCISGALYTCCYAFDRYNMDLKRPFPFFSRAVHNGLYQAWNDMYKKTEDYDVVYYTNIFNESV